ncbi:MAG: S41 family peptidase [Chloroflexi bacterium]|jgi:carboxyl-terminal processing protease|nr:S41 family peptidase [Chloroflexota bacterium]
MNWKRAFTIYFLGLLTFGMAFALGYFVRAQFYPSLSEYPIWNEARQILRVNALYDPPPDPALEYGMIRGMLAVYDDPYTRFVEPARTELDSDNLEGSYGGIGATLERGPEDEIFVYPFPDSPAAEAGVQAGDQLLRVDELVIAAATPIDEVVAALRGPEGDLVTIEIARPTSDSTESFTIQRAAIPLPSVTWRLALEDARLGIIKVNLIAASTAAEIEKAAADLDAQGAHFYALDLRGNGGGLVDAGVEIARLFLTEGDILQEQYRGDDPEIYTVRRPGPLSEIPLVVLVDANTASAAEIVAGALQTRGRAALIGQPTYGKDVIQLAFELSDGSSLHVTAAQWQIPGLDANISAEGLQPDVRVKPGEDGQDTTMLAAVVYFSP